MGCGGRRGRWRQPCSPSCSTPTSPPRSGRTSTGGPRTPSPVTVATDINEALDGRRTVDRVAGVEAARAVAQALVNRLARRVGRRFTAGIAVGGGVAWSAAVSWQTVSASVAVLCGHPTTGNPTSPTPTTRCSPRPSTGWRTAARHERPHGRPRRSSPGGAGPPAVRCRRGCGGRRPPVPRQPPPPPVHPGRHERVAARGRHRLPLGGRAGGTTLAPGGLPPSRTAQRRLPRLRRPHGDRAVHRRPRRRRRGGERLGHRGALRRGPVVELPPPPARRCPGAAAGDPGGASAARRADHAARADRGRAPGRRPPRLRRRHHPAAQRSVRPGCSVEEVPVSLRPLRRPRDHGR